MPVSDAGLRRLAWAVFVACCGCYVLLGTYSQIARLARGGSVNPVDFALAAMTFAFPVAGVLVANRQPRNPIGWLMLAMGLVVATPLSVYADYGLKVRPGSLPGAAVAAGLTTADWAPAIGLVATYLILLFPDGHLPSPRWRPVGWFVGLAVTWVYLLVTLLTGDLKDDGFPGVHNPLQSHAVVSVEQLLLPTIVVLPISILLSAAGLVARFRRSSGVERLQLKWLTTAGAVVALLYLAAVVGSLASGLAAWGRNKPDPPWLLVIQNVAIFSFVLIPIAIGVAVLKHGLYEIDIVINKALVFGALAAFITAVYVAIVVGVGRLFGGGDRPNLALSIAATAVVAVAFQPVRERVQRVANRLVYGERATPYEVLSEFADRVGGSYDAAELLPMMARTVAEGVGAKEVEVWLATGPGWVREASWPQGAATGSTGEVAAITDVAGDRVVEVRHQGELLGALVVAKPAGEVLNPTEEQLLDDVAGQAGLVLRNVRLIEDLRSSRQRLVTTQDEERRRLERNLHDGAQQSLVSVMLMLNTARARLSPDLKPSLGPALDQAEHQLRQAIGELRELARGIHPAILTERGLGAAVQGLADRSPVPVVVEDALEGRLPGPVEASLYFVVAEALTNVAKYARATQVSVTLSRLGGSVVVAVRDDGIGGADASRGSGLRGLVDRVAVVDGTLNVSSPPGRGTTLTCTVPVPARNAPYDEAAAPALAGRP